MNKKRIIIVIAIIIILIFLIKTIFPSKEINYKLWAQKTKFEITQIKNDNYTYIEIKTKNHTYPIKLFDKYRNNKLINNIYYYTDDDYECIIPLIKGEVKVDGMCYKEDKLYRLSEIDDNNIDSFIAKSKKYSASKYDDDLSNGIKNSTITEYKSNKIDKSVAVSTYKGIYNKSEYVDIFAKDVYENELSIFIDNYYLVADYNSSYTFDKFYLIDLDTNKSQEIKMKYDISFDSYIQGVIDNIIYLYDIDNECQYTIDVSNKTIKLIADEDIKYYTNGKWETITTKKANKKLYFDYTTLDDPYKKYDGLIKNDNSKIYYVLKESDNKYKIYLSYYENTDILRYITTTNTSNIYSKDNYIYYVDSDCLYYYDDVYGLKILLKNTEFKFNDTIKYYVY